VDDSRNAVPAGKSPASRSLVEDGVRALVELGYKKQNAQEAVQKVLKNGTHLSVSDLVRASLKYV
jgi:Holliday junction resolvasome RuvABC DNA-binding subunit